MMKKKRTTVTLDETVAKLVAAQAKIHSRSFSGMVNWMLGKQVGEYGDADIPEDTE